MMMKRKTNALKTACLYLLILLIVFTAAFTTACNGETQNAVPPDRKSTRLNSSH